MSISSYSHREGIFHFHAKASQRDGVPQPRSQEDWDVAVELLERSSLGPSYMELTRPVDLGCSVKNVRGCLASFPYV